MSALWVFGYGSLCWNPGFEYSDAHVGYVKGFKRRFWQGNDAHRGTPEKLGRVVTLIEDETECTWGKSFQMNDETASREYLDNRESTLGGYTTIITTFYPRDQNVAPFPVLVYMATAENSQYLGPAPLPQIAHEIATSRGNAGHNVEYLAKLALFMRLNVPEVHDEHLYRLEALCKQFVQELNPSLLSFFAPTDVNTILEQMSDFSLPNTPVRKSPNDNFKSEDEDELEANGSMKFTHLRRELSWHRRLSQRMNTASRTQLELMRKMTEIKEKNAESVHESTNNADRLVDKADDFSFDSEESQQLSSSDESSDSDLLLTEDEDDQQCQEEKKRSVLFAVDQTTRPIAINYSSNSSKLVRACSMDSHVAKMIGSTARSFVRSVSRLEKKPEFGSMSDGTKSPVLSSHFIDFVNVRQLRCVKI